MFGEQTTWGTAVTPTHSLQLADVQDVSPQDSNFRSEKARASTAPSETRKGRYHKAYTITTELESTDNLFLLKNLCGNYAFAADTPVAGARTHTIKLGGAAAEIAQMFTKGFTLEYGRGSKFYTVDSCVCTGVTIDVSDQGVIQAVYSILGREETEAGSAAGTLDVSDPAIGFDNLQMVLAWGVDASEVTQPVEAFTINLEREDVNPRFILSSNLATQYTYGDFTNVTGSFKIDVAATERAAILDDYDNDTESSMVLTFTSNQIVTGSTAFSLVIDIPEAKIDGKEWESDGNTDFETYGFAAGIGGGTDLVTITAVTDELTL
jgi:hypothetical protein